MTVQTAVAKHRAESSAAYTNICARAAHSRDGCVADVDWGGLAGAGAT